MTDAALQDRRITRWTLTAGLCLAVISAPFAANALAYLILQPIDRLSTVSVGFVTGMAVGQIIGIRRGGLSSFLIGPALGLLIGYLDLKGFIWLYMFAAVPLMIASVIPIWGTGFAIWVASYRKSWRQRTAVACTIGLLSLLSIGVWTTLGLFGILEPLGSRVVFLEPLVFVAPALAAVLLTVPRRSE